MSDALQSLWRRSDIRGHAIEDTELRTWPQSHLRVILAQRLIRRIGDAHSIVCDDCGPAHSVDVIRDPRRRGRFHYYCPSIGRISVPAESLKRWEVAFDSLGRALHAGMSLEGDLAEIAPTRVWFLGRHRNRRTTTEVFLLRGIWWPDANDLLDSCVRLQQSPDPIILIPRRYPTQAVWAGRKGSLHALAEIVELTDSGLNVRIDLIEALRRRVATPGVADGASSEPASRAKIPRSIGSPEAVQAVLNFIQLHVLDHDQFGGKFNTSGRAIRNFLSTGKIRRSNFRDMAAYLKLSVEELLRGEAARRTA